MKEGIAAVILWTCFSVDLILEVSLETTTFFLFPVSCFLPSLLETLETHFSIMQSSSTMPQATAKSLAYQRPLHHKKHD